MFNGAGGGEGVVFQMGGALFLSRGHPMGASVLMGGVFKKNCRMGGGGGEDDREGGGGGGGGGCPPMPPPTMGNPALCRLFGKIKKAL